MIKQLSVLFQFIIDCNDLSNSNNPKTIFDKLSQDGEQRGITLKAPAIFTEQRETQRLRAENEQLRSDNVLSKKETIFLH